MSIHAEHEYDDELEANEDYDDEELDSDDEDDGEDDDRITNHHNHHRDELNASDDDRSAGSDDRGGTPVPSEAASEAVVVEAENSDDDDEEVLTATAIIETSADGDSAKKRKRPGPKPKRRRIESDREEAAAEARAMLQHSVTRLPMTVGESHVVRSLGSICTDDERFSSAHHIYPAGFSCDRYEFSPVHGRILKLRCAVLDGRKVRARQKELGVKVTATDGPLFRIMWGSGIDDDNESPPEYRYDMEACSPQININSYLPSNQKKLEPEIGMRVRVKYEGNQWYSGTIVDVDETANGETEISVQYDDGSTEQAIYPDPDIILFLPGEF